MMKSKPILMRIVMRTMIIQSMAWLAAITFILLGIYASLSNIILTILSD